MNEELSVYERRKNLIEKYMNTVQSNQTDFINEIFTNDASLEIKAHTTYVSFPELTRNTEEINKVLVSDFNDNYENISIFCFIDTLTNEKDSITCNILICMQEKESKSILLSYGLYVWEFSKDSETKVSKLNIEIEKLLVLNPSQEKIIFTWISRLPQYWVERKEILKEMPSLQHLKFLRDKLKEKSERINDLYINKKNPMYKHFVNLGWVWVVPFIIFVEAMIFPKFSTFFDYYLHEFRIGEIRKEIIIYLFFPSSIIASFITIEIDSKFNNLKRRSYKLFYILLIPQILIFMYVAITDIFSL